MIALASLRTIAAWSVGCVDRHGSWYLSSMLVLAVLTSSLLMISVADTDL